MKVVFQMFPTRVRALIIGLLTVMATTVATVGAPPAAAQEPLLVRGSTGAAVAEWQDQLNRWLSTARAEQGQLAEDGIYGPLTAAATRDFQQAAGITVDGIVGPVTRGALADALEDEGAPPAGGVLSVGDTGQAVAQWQEQLNAVRGPDIAVDGIFGPVTREATIAFQQAQGISVDGVVGPETRGAMDAALSDGTGDEEGLDAEDVLSPAIDTSTDTGDPAAPPVTVTDIRVGSHEGFDRVTFAIGGPGQAGWEVGYVDEATAQGSGEPVAVDGDAVLEVRLTNVALPTEAPAEPWAGPDTVAAPGSGPLTEVVDDTVFEGTHTFFLGVDAEQPFQVRRFEDPQRVVVDVAS